MKEIFYLGALLLTFKAGAQTPAFSVADSLYAVGAYSKAIMTYEAKPNLSAKDFLNVARSYKGLGNRAAALEYYQESCTADPNLVIASVEFGKLSITTKKYTQADSIFSNLLERYPDNPEFYYQKGVALSKLKVDPTKLVDSAQAIKLPKQLARESFAKAVQLDSSHQKAIYQLARNILTKEKKFPEVEKLCFKALESAPENVEIIGLLAQSFYYREFFRDAAKQFERLLELGQESLFIYEKLGLCYENKREYEKAIPNFEAVIQKYDDENLLAHSRLANCYLRIRDLKKAESYAQIALFLADNSIENEYYGLAQVYDVKQEYGKAIKYYSNTLSENTDRIDAAYGKVVAADKYYKDKAAIIKGYEKFFTDYENDGRISWYHHLLDKRISALKEELFFEEDKDD